MMSIFVCPYFHGEAYFIGGENMDELIARTGDNPHHGAK